MNKCPSCQSDNIRTFENGCTLIKGSGKHHMCNNCRQLWSDEHVAQIALGTDSNDKPKRKVVNVTITEY